METSTAKVFHEIKSNQHAVFRNRDFAGTTSSMLHSVTSRVVGEVNDDIRADGRRVGGGLFAEVKSGRRSRAALAAREAARAAPAMAAAVFPRPLALAKREEGGEIWSSGSWTRREEARAGPRGRRSAQGLARRRRRTGSGGGRWKGVVSPQRRFCGFFVSRFARGRRSFT